MKRSKLNLSHEVLISCNQGELVPLMCEEVVPGDVWQQSSSILLRTQPLAAPVYHKCDVSVFHVFVPNRIIWQDWEDFITGGRDGTAAPVSPTITFPDPGVQVGSLASALGISTNTPFTMPVSALPFRAYALTVNDLFLDQQLQDPVPISYGSGPDTTTSVAMVNGCWQRDYFTSARPEPQLGDAVSIPLLGTAPITGKAPITGIGKLNQTFGGSDGLFYETDGTRPTYPIYNYSDGTSGSTAFGIKGTASTGYPDIWADADNSVSDMEADLSSVSTIDIDQFNLLTKVQRFKQVMNNFGAKYNDYLRSIFSVMPRDSRLQRPEVLATGKMVIQFSEVLQTAEGTGNVGDLYGHGISVGASNRFRYFVPEHGFILTLMCVRPKTVYTQMLQKKWDRPTRYDYLIPMFATLGDQPIKNKEVYAAHTTPEGTFGYVPRYDEYRFVPNRVAGEFLDTLDYWHMARIFDSDPALNADFVEANPTDRIYTTNADQLLIRCLHSIQAKRPLPRFPKSRIG